MASAFDKKDVNLVYAKIVRPILPIGYNVGNPRQGKVESVISFQNAFEIVWLNV